MKYPYIGKGSRSGAVFLFLSEGEGLVLEQGFSSFTGRKNNIAETLCRNITAEYLANTKIKYESQEHKIFILNMIAVNGLHCFVSGGFIYVSSNENCNVFDPKQITIPLPPESNVNTPEEDFEMKQIEKNNGDNLIFGDADKCKEWPCVNDEVQTSDGNGLVKLLPDSKGYYVVSVNGEYYQYQVDELSKPKTPEQELRDEILDCIHNHNEIWRDNNNEMEVSVYEFVGDALLSKYNITKKPQ